VDVVAIGVDGHGPTLVPVDEHGDATRPAVTFLDTRATAEAAELADATGIRGWALGPLPAALWLERHEPEVAARTRWYLTTWEWLALRLTGVAAAPLVPGQSTPDASRLIQTGLRLDRRPEPTAMGAVVGRLTRTAAEALGLQAGIPVAGGTNDAFASYLGAGLTRSGDAYDPGGSAGGFGVYWHEPVEVPGAFVTSAPLEGLYSVGAAMAATGRALDWFRDGVVGGGISTERLLEEAGTTPPGADGVVFLPYLAGERSPIWDPDATGAFVGLTLTHARAHLVRAILEASALAIRHVATPMLRAGVTVTAMRVCGGPARSETWNQIKADVTGFPVLVPAVLETAVLGSAMLGAVGIGASADIPTAVRSMTRIERRLEPRAEHRATYDRAFEVYRGLYPALRPLLEGAP
jgi:xylulokinase